MEPPSSHPSLMGAAALPTGASTTAPTTGPPSWPGTTPYSQNIPPEVIDQIEVLKQQLRVYADDFATEREDRERNQAEKEKMRDELAAVKEQVQALEQQVSFVYEVRPCLKALMVIVMNRQTFEITETIILTIHWKCIVHNNITNMSQNCSWVQELGFNVSAALLTWIGYSSAFHTIFSGCRN